MAADRLTGNPIVKIKFDEDTVLAKVGQPFIVKKIRMLSVADGDIFELEDADGNEIFHMVQTGGADMVECDFGDKGFDFGKNGCTIDFSDCTGLAATDGTDAVWFYMV